MRIRREIDLPLLIKVYGNLTILEMNEEKFRTTSGVNNQLKCSTTLLQSIGFQNNRYHRRGVDTMKRGSETSIFQVTLQASDNHPSQNNILKEKTIKIYFFPKVCHEKYTNYITLLNKKKLFTL